MSKLDITNFIINEDLTNKQKSIVNNWQQENKESGEDVDPSHHNDLFERHTNDPNSSRLVIPLSHHDIKFNPDVAKHLHENGGWTIHDYVGGIATRKLKTKKGFVKPEYKSIGAILAETGGQDKKITTTDSNGNQVEKPLSHVFQNDPTRKNMKSNGLQIVVSRHPYDIGGMTSGRSWETTCMRLPHGRNTRLSSGGEHHSYIQSDLSHQTLAAYLTHEGDHTAKAPLARILLKRHTNNEGHDIWRPEQRVYGNADGSFMKSVTDFARKEFPSAPNSKYKKNSDLYDDDEQKTIKETPSKEGSPLEDIITEHHLSKSAKVIHHTNDSLGNYHSFDDKPSLVIQDGNKTHKWWHKNGDVHRDNAPAYIKEATHPNGTISNVVKQHYQYGSLHSPKNGTTPSIEDTDYDEHGNVTAISHEHHKFGFEHNGVMSGLSSLYMTPHGIGAVKSVYGEPHTDNEEPSRYNLSLNSNGTKGYETKSWHTHGIINKEVKTEYDQHGNIKDHQEYNHTSNIPNNGIISHTWSNGEGIIKKSLGDGKSVTHEYKSSTPTEEPEHITNTIYRDSNGSVIKNPDDNHADYSIHSEKQDVEKHYDEQGKLHNENGPASIEIERDKTGKTVKYNMSHMVHGEYDLANTKVGDVVHHTYDGDTDTGKILQNNGHGQMVQMEFKGGVDGYKNKSNITALAHLNRKGDITHSLDESPSILNKDSFAYVDDHGEYNSNKENVPSNGKIIKKSKKHIIGKTISVYGVPMSGRKISVDSDKKDTVVTSSSPHGYFTHRFDENGKYKGSTIDFPETGGETVHADKEGNLVDKDGYGISLSKERSIEKQSPEDFKIMSQTKDLSHITDHIKLPDKIHL